MVSIVTCALMSQKVIPSLAKLARTSVINHNFNRNDKCIICLLTCNKCKMQYLGKIVDAFRLRWNNYKDNIGNTLRKNHICNSTYLNTS